MMRLTLTPCSLIIAVLLGNNLMFASSMSLHHTTVSDLPTPSFLIDMDMLHKASASIQTTPLPSTSSSSSSSSSTTEKNLEITYPCLSLPKYGKILVPHPQSINTARRIDSTDNDTPTPNKSNPPYDVSNFRGRSALGYIYASVSMSKSCPVGKETHSRDGTFLAEIDVPYGLGRNSQLVMGINNHHVGSYYWARSVGMGASMEAPGGDLSETAMG